MFQSLRAQFLIPLVCSILLSVAAVAIGSYFRAAIIARESIEQRLRSVASLVGESTFPLTPSVLEQMHALSFMEIAIVETNGRIAIATSGIADRVTLFHSGIESKDLLNRAEPSLGPTKVVIEHRFDIGGIEYDVGLSKLSPANVTRGQHVVAVLSRHDRQQQLLRQALALPIATGVATALAIGGVAAFLVRIGRRLDRLRSHVGRISSGNFELLPEIGPDDSILRLTSGINQMTSQLNVMQTAMNVHQRATLINQIASGMAHQLRNTLTGARLAVQVHQRNCPSDSSVELVAAIDQLKLAEQSIQSLLQIRTGIDEKPSDPLRIGEIVQQLNSLVMNKANHKSIQLGWYVSDEVAIQSVPDGQAVLGALLNLLINAIEAVPNHGNVDCKVEFEATVSGSMEVDSTEKTLRGFCRFSVIDDGPGPAVDVQTTMLEPFITTKPEGVGLGLPMANRIAQRLGGFLEWQRMNERTCFVLSIPTLEE